jgi:transcriptional regulator with XRE-family HTH domain
VARLQEAREALGQRLRELRLQRGLSGTALAESLGWAQSKVSKIETGRQTPTESDIRAWTQATESKAAAVELIARLQTLESMYAEWRRQLGAGTSSRQRASIELESRATVIRAFESTVIPGLLQTPDYARHRLAQSVRRHQILDDVDEGVRVRMQRQEVLYRPGKRFHFVVTEAALWYRLCPPEVMVGQLDRLVAMSAMSTLRLGVISFDTELPESPKHGFWIFDDQMVLVETIAAELTLKQPQEIALYTQVFERLASVASYGTDARRIVIAVLEDLSGAPRAV